MMNLVFVNCYDKNAGFRIQKFTGKFQPFFHHRQPLTMPPSIIRIHIIIIILPVPCPGIIRRIDVYAVHFSLIQVFQELERVVVIGFDDGVPQFVIRRVFDFGDGFERREDWFADEGYGYKFVEWQCSLFGGRFVYAQRVFFVDFEDGVYVIDFACFAGDGRTAPDGYAV